jgi:hypothetical protein
MTLLYRGVGQCADGDGIALPVKVKPADRAAVTQRFSRLTNAFSKKLENHALSIAVHYVHYNSCRIHKTLRITAAMAAGVTDRVWDVADIVALVEAAESAPAKRGPYKKRAA